MRTLFLISCMGLLHISAVALKRESAPPTAVDTSENEGQTELLVYDYIFPHEKDVLSPILYADWKSVHAEVRYNYEDLHTASVFGGCRFETGEKLVVGATPVLGIVFGNTSGLAPGLLLDLAYGKFDFYSESEYVIDFSGSENNFFYTWTELAITPLENLRTGISANRTRLYQSELDVQKGIFAQYTFQKATAGFHYFNPFTDDYYFVTSISYAF